MNRKLCTFRQRQFEILSEYLRRFKNTVDQINEKNGNIGFSSAMIDAELTDHVPLLKTETTTMEQYEQTGSTAKEKYLTVAFLSGSAEHHHA